MDSHYSTPAAPARSVAAGAHRGATVHLVFGPQGAGKSTHASALARQVNGVCFSIDTWMLDLYGPDMLSPLDFAWLMQRVRRCETRIWKTAVTVARQGMDVVLDVGCMKAADRQRFLHLAEEASLLLQSHFLSADAEARRQRVVARNTERGDTFAFPVSPAMFDMMEAQYEAPSEQELACATVLRT